jgi:Arylsulfotransferase (ASST)
VSLYRDDLLFLVARSVFVMRCIIIAFVFLLGCGTTVAAEGRVLPAEGSALNYRIAGFSVPAVKGGHYILEIADGYFNDRDSFAHNIVVSAEADTNRVVAALPAFGHSYTWRMYQEGAKSGAPLHHFSTMMADCVDPAKTRLRIIKKTKRYKDCYLFIDGNRALYDMKGEPVWFLPDEGLGFRAADKELRDIKVTKAGTITFLSGARPYEVSYDGTILWKAPDDGAVSGDFNTERYHHQLDRLPNGHYMTLGTETVLVNIPDMKKGFFNILWDKPKKDSMNSQNFLRSTAGTIIEYDGAGKVVWSWHSADYINHEGADIAYYHRREGFSELNLHENAFYFDRDSGYVYYGLRNVSRILKIKYPEGNVVRAYGDIYKQGHMDENYGPFCRQHSIAKGHDGTLYIYDNNSCTINGNSKILAAKEPATGTQLSTVWDYSCTIDEKWDTVGGHFFVTGGNAVLLPDDALLVCMGGSFSKLFIMDQDSNVLWSAMPEVWQPLRKRWYINYSYRVSMINSRADLEHLIWGEELNQVN